MKIRASSSGPAPSRNGKGQVVVFVKPALAEQVRSHAAKGGRTIQEVLGDAINRSLEAKGGHAIFPLGHARVFVRSFRTSQPRQGDTTTKARQGKKSLCGWYPRACIRRANQAAGEMGTTLQDLAATGLADLVKSR